MANPKLNKKVKSFLDSYLKDTPKNSPEYQHAIMLILRGALTDANFHSEARQLDKMFPAAKKSKYVGTDMETVIEDKGIDIAKAAKWDGYEIIDAFVAYTNNTKLDSLKEGFYSKYVSEFLNEVAMGEDENDPEEIKVNNYQTKYFHVCPGASNLYKDIESKGVDMDMAERSARLQDALFFVEEHIQRDGYKPERDYVMVANNLAANIMKLGKMMGLEKEHSYIQGHVDTIKKVVEKNGLEELRMMGEEVEKLQEDNCPTDSSKWSYYKSQAKKKFDVYPSAYANGWASKQYKAAGGGWKACKKESVNELNVKTYRSAIAKGLERGDDKGREIATKAIELMGREIAKELKGISLEIKPTKVEGFHRNYFRNKPPMTGQYKMTFTGEGKLHKPDLKIDTKDVTLFLKAEVATPVELGGWGGPLELRGYRGGKSITFQVSLRNGSVEVYPYGSGSGMIQFTRSGARLLAATAASMHIALGGDGKIKHNSIKQFTAHKSESVNEKSEEEKADYVSGYDAVKEDSKRDYKKEYEKYGKSEKAKKYRAELNKYNREKGTYGNGDGKDASHKGGKIVGFEDESKNRGRREKSRLKKEGMVEPRRGHNYYQLTKDTPIKYISGYSNPTGATGVLLHNEYSTFKGNKGAYIIDYFGAHFYVDIRNKFASKIANPRDDEQTRGLMRNVNRVGMAPEHSDWKKYMKESVTESISINEGLDLVEQIIFMIIVAANVYDGSISKPIIKFFKNRKEIKAIVKRVAKNRDLVAAAKSKDDSKFYELLRDTLTDSEFDTLFKVGANYDKVKRGIARESVNEAYVVMYAKNKGEKPSAAAYRDKDMALKFEKDLKKDGYITMVTQKKVKGVDESINEEYYKQASEAADAARKYAEKKGYEIDEDDWQSQIAAGGKYGRLRPGKEKTHTFSIKLLKNGKPQRKMLQVSLYGMPSGKYELTTYIN